MSRERGDYHGDEDEIEFILTKEDFPDEDLINELRETSELNRIEKLKS
jgi:hypothetical protein